MQPVKVVLVAQGSRWSHCTPTLMDEPALGTVADGYFNCFRDLQSTGYR